MPFVKVEEAKLELQMTSMIDVVFQLLIFFLVTMRIPKPEQMIETELPKAQQSGQTTAQEEQKKEFEDILLSIGQDQSKQVKVLVNGQWMMTDGMLLNRLEMFKNLNSNGRVVIHCQDIVPYKYLIRTISIVQTAQLPMAFANIE